MARGSKLRPEIEQENPAKDVNNDEMKSGAIKKNREIPGNFPYMTSHGTLKKVLDKVIEAQRPERFNPDFLENVLKMKGGTARSTISILKKMGFLSSDGTPTELYAKFKTDSGRSAASLKGLQNGFAEVFRKSEYAHVAGDNKIRDLLIETTGLRGNDPILNAIKGTFNVVNSYVKSGEKGESSTSYQNNLSPSDAEPKQDEQDSQTDLKSGIGLIYNINIVILETSDLTVLNAIFKSLKENILK